MEQFEHLEETQLSSEAKYDGTLLHIRRDTVRLPDGKTATREYNIHNGAVCIIPLLENGEVLLERQYRYPLREVITEIPAGKLDAPDEDPLEAAQRELREETGATAAECGNYLEQDLPGARAAAARMLPVLAHWQAGDLQYTRRE